MAELLFQLALTFVPNIGPVQAKILLQHFDVQDIFKAKKSQLEKLEGIGSVRAESIKSFADFSKAEEEIAFIEKYKIKTLFIADKDYPGRLLNCYDSPTLLFYKGEADLNHKKNRLYHRYQKPYRLWKTDNRNIDRRIGGTGCHDCQRSCVWY